MTNTTRNWKFALALTVVTTLSISALAQDSESEQAAATKNLISFNLVANPKFVDCLRASPESVPKAHATVTRGKLNDTLVLTLSGIKPGLSFDLFTVQRSPFLSAGVPNPGFTGSFGLAWYQSDIQVGAHSEQAQVIIQTILLDQIFGFDPDAALSPTNTFHLGFWFNNPEEAVACGFDPTKPTPFNGEHKAGPLAMISVPNPATKLGPLCTQIEPGHPGKCDL